MSDRPARMIPRWVVKLLSWASLILVVAAIVLEKQVLLWLAAATSFCVCVYLLWLGRRNTGRFLPGSSPVKGKIVVAVIGTLAAILVVLYFVTARYPTS